MAWNDERDNILIELYINRDISAKQISKIMGIPERTLYNRIKKLNIETKVPHNKVSYDIKDKIMKEFSKKPTAKLAEELGITLNTVNKIAYSNNLKKENSMSAESNFIKNNYRKLSVSDIAKKTKLTKKSVRDRAFKLGVAKKQEFPYSLQTIQTHEDIKRRYADESTFKLSAELGIPDRTIRKIAKKYNIKKNRKIARKKRKIYSSWTEREILFLKDNCIKKTVYYLSSKLKRTPISVRSKIRSLGFCANNLKIYSRGNIYFTYNTEHEKEEKLEYITMFNKLLHERSNDYTSRENYDIWSEEDILFLKNNYQNKSIYSLSKILKRKQSSVRSKIRSLGLHIDNLKAYSRGNLYFTYNTEYEMEEKLEYITMFNNLLSERRKDYVSRKN